ncbi:Fic family protein [Pedobacter sp. UYEF25]
MDKEDFLREYDEALKNYTELIVKSFRKKDFREYSEILFSAHSCAIEGNSFSVNDTKELREKGIGLKLQDKSLLEAYEILDHFSAYDFIYDNLDAPLSEDLLKKVHSMVTQNTIKYTKGMSPGEYTNTQMAAGDTIFGDYEANIAKVPELMELTQKAIDRAEIHPLEISARFHKFFIYLHPFPDGNGRVGRLISNLILAKFGHPNIIIEAREKQQYINALKITEKHKDLDVMTIFFAKTCVDRMKTEISQKQDLTQNPSMSFEAKEKKGRKL